MVEAGNQNNRGGSSTIFSVVPHLIMVFNYGTAMIPLDMLQTKCTFLVVIDMTD
jgi:hypothetical protein